jgi:hypothetical protein
LEFLRIQRFFAGLAAGFLAGGWLAFTGWEGFTDLELTGAGLPFGFGVTDFDGAGFGAVFGTGFP